MIDIYGIVEVDKYTTVNVGATINVYSITIIAL
jgi:hypothetical protein